ncbi:hypothetical protein A3C91_00900 [Candidatus Azambacteria bacterium RIFCSPHIGHO2_02_FULL_52_12]|uniref:Pyridoxamine 5'-phosphate oxidase N-terminal domain-containing protein n=1 Tax=Candidatus Azambacteria bacterium RIFCSPLOWO2_01_FULL_46_25 TaxID=1797298 RepID=A0A1F5BTZ4_9BACT|nr:MAG: hypothetical protein A3C91_00900 [Candidatus Azambacteria bacterium RIFCSPHIGHO2_02_FULL_52_12]OGD34080.1 MAG: hypothetical protein A2988_01180 [Candidatus Azambacteria bacterium RIFCSPLOWO2_01_FULL_46_25]OGD36679.1 MAG: hypothetical protein A2850_00135 [Candidatus Azambacteria bacterium RIFCSPHIGHO2_01_FULL_51_74]
MTKADAQKFCMVFLREQEHAVLATVNAGGRPQAAVVTYFVEDDWTFYFTTRRETRKHENLMHNRRVAMVVGTGPGPVSIQIEGTAEPVEGTERETVMGAFLTKRKSYYDIFLKIPGYDFSVFKVRPDWIRLFQINDGAGAEVFTRII